MTYLLETHGLSKNFWRKTALNSVDLQIEPSSINAIIGPNGAGKSTLLKILVNLVTPSSGRVSIFGTDSSRLSVKELNAISFISEQQKLPERMTLAQLLDYCQALYKNWDSDYVNSMIRDFDLDSSQKIVHLSRGNHARLQMIIGMGYRPNLFILDEIFSGLDPIARDDVSNALISVVREFGATVIFASHEMDDVERLADTVGFLNEGELKHFQATEELIESYRLIEIEGGPNIIADLPQVSDFHSLETNGQCSSFIAHINSLTRFKESFTENTAQASFSISPANLKQIFRVLKRDSARGE